MKVSIIVPNYNDSRELEDCLRSIQNQTYQDFEVWITDNCSTDDSLAVAKLYEKDPRFKILSNPQHTRNSVFGINRAMKEVVTGEVATWLNSDDHFFPTYLASILPYFEDPAIGFVRVGIFAWFEDTSKTSKTLPLYKWDRLGDIVMSNKVYPGSPFRSKLFYEIGGMCEEMNFFDWDFWIRCAIDGCGFRGWTYKDCEKPLVIRKIHKSQDSTKESLDEGARQIIRKYVRTANYDTII